MKFGDVSISLRNAGRVLEVVEAKRVVVFTVRRMGAGGRAFQAKECRRRDGNEREGGSLGESFHSKHAEWVSRLNAVRDKGVRKERVEGQGRPKRERGGKKKREKSRELEMSVDRFQDIMVARDSGLGFGRWECRKETRRN